MNKYRTHTCGELNLSHKGTQIILSGWINKKRDHGNLLFIDLRDNYGLTQCVIDKSNSIFSDLEKLPLETVIKIQGTVIGRTKETVNPGIKTGQVVGRSDEQGAYILDRPVSIGDVFATVYKALGIDWHKEYMTPVGRPIKIANSFDDLTGKPLVELI